MSTSEVISDIRELPNWSSVLTAAGQQFDLRTDDKRRTLCVLRLTPDSLNRVLILDARSSMFDLVQIRNAAEKAGYQVSAVRQASEDVLANISALSIGTQDDDPAQNNIDLENEDSSQRFVYWVETTVRLGASDIHIETGEDFATIRLRLDGRLVELADPVLSCPAKVARKAISTGYLLYADPATRPESAYSDTEIRDCIIEREIDGERHRLRFESIPTVAGVDCVMRVLHLDKESETVDLPSLGLEAWHVDQITLGMRKRTGLIVIAGMTGDGKSTTLSALQTADPHKLTTKRWSLEDPVETRQAHLSQVSVRSEAEALLVAKHLLRADPDSIALGEVRNKEMGQLVQGATQSGHKTFLTTHVSCALGAISRLTDPLVGMDRQILCSRGFLVMLIYQKLIPLLCPECAVPAVDVLDARYLQEIADIFTLDERATSQIMAAGSGCEHCRRTGRKGRTAVMEIVMPDARLLQLLREGRDGDAEDYWRGQRMSGFSEGDMTGKTAFEHGIYKVLHGLIDPRDLEDAFEPFRTYRHSMPQGMIP